MTTLSTIEYTHRKCEFHPCPTGAAILRSEMRRNFPDSTTSVCSFVFEYAQKSSPTRITDAFGEMMIFHQAFDVQVFNPDFIEAFDQVETGFVKEILALTLDLQMLFGEKFYRFTTTGRAFLSTAHLTLCGLQSFLSLTQPFEVLNGRLLGRKSGKVFYTNINTNTFA